MGETYHNHGDTEHSAFGRILHEVHEQNYATHGIELVAVVFILHIWKHYLYGVSFQFFTYHKRLKYIFAQKDLNRKHCIWLEFLANYDIGIAYHSGKANVVIDALSKRLIVHGVGLVAVGTEYVDQREDAVNQHLAVVLARLMIGSTIAGHIRQAHADDQLLE